MEHLLESIAVHIEYAGVAVIVIGLIVAAGIFILNCARHGVTRESFETLRANLGRAILIGLELLVAADIIFTIVSPLTLESVGLLGLLILIRTFLSFSLETEIEGVWPWKRRMMSESDDQVR